MNNTDAFEKLSGEMADAIERLRDTRSGIEAMMTAQLRKFLPVGHKIDLQMSKKLECAIIVKVGSGNAHPKHLAGFEIISEPQVSVKDDPCDATWSARAYALNQDGKRMNGKTHSVGSTEEVRIYSTLFSFLDGIAELHKVENGQPHIDFAAAYVNNWMASNGPQDYVPHTPAPPKKTLRP